MTPERWQKVGSLFLRLMDLTALKRRDVLSTECKDDPELRQEVEALIAADANASRAFGSDEACAQRLVPDAHTQSSTSGADDEPKKNSLFTWAAVGCCCCFSALVFCILYLTVINPVPLRRFGWRAQAKQGVFVITEVYASEPASGRLFPGDRLVSINGDTRVRRAGYLLKLGHLPAGSDAYTVEVERAERIITEQLRIGRRAPPDVLATLFQILQIVLVFFVISLATIRRDNMLAVRVLFFAAFAFFSHALANYLVQSQSILGENFFRTKELLVPIFPQDAVLAYFFFSRFPGSLRYAQRWSIRDYLIIIAATLIFLPRCYLAFVRAAGENAALNFANEHWTVFQAYSASSVEEMEPWYLSWWDELFCITCLVLATACLARNYFTLQDLDDRRRVRWILCGLIAGLSPTIVVAACDVASHGLVTRTNIFQSAVVTAAAPYLIIYSVCYAVFTRRIPGAEVVIRRTVHLLLNAVSGLGLLVPLLLIIVPILSEPDRPINQVLPAHLAVIYSLLVVASSANLFFRGTLAQAIDKRFFRTAYQQDEILLNLGQTLNRVSTLSDVSGALLTEIDRALQPRRLSFYRRSRDGDHLTREPAIDSAHSTIPAHSPLVALLEHRDSPVDYPFRKSPSLNNADRHLLQDESPVLIVPCLTTERRLNGIILLGEKLSNEPYSSTNRRLLQVIASQVAMSLDNASLREKVRRQDRVQLDIFTQFDRNNINILKICQVCNACYPGSATHCTSDGQELLVDPPIQSIVEERYELKRLLGKGGMGTVFLAKDLILGREVALKAVFDWMSNGDTGLVRFRREAQVLSKLAHPNIVSIYDFGSLGDRGGYFVMEYAPGVTWGAELRNKGRFSPELLATRVNQVLNGISAAHLKGIAHRDLKPDNLLMSRTNAGEVVKIVDFGLAKLIERNASSAQGITASCAFMGTPGYMAPEQAFGFGDERSDIFAIAVIVVESLTGSRPSDDSSVDLLIGAIAGAFPQAHSPLRRLSEILQKCMRQDPGQRYSRIDEFHSDLLAAIAAVKQP